MLLDGDARNAARAPIDAVNAERWTLRQVITDPEDHLEWAATFEIDVPQSRDHQRPIVRLVGLGVDAE